MIESRRAIKKLDQSVDDLEGSAVHPEVGELIICNSCSSSRQVANLTSEQIDWSIHGSIKVLVDREPSKKPSKERSRE